MIYIHDDLNGYAGWADTGGPLQAGEDDPLLAALNAQTVTTVTLAYLQGDARGLRAITVAEPQSLWYRGPDLPAASGPVHPRPVPRLEQIPDQVTVLPEFIDATIGPTIARVGQRLDNMLVTLTTGMTAAEVYSIIRGIDPGHHAEIELALARLRKSMGDQWNRDLDTDTNQPTRPTLTLDRDRETMPNPDPDHVAQDRATIVRDLDAIDDLRAMVATAIEKVQATDPIPGNVPQQTAWPVNLVAQAVTDAPSGTGWTRNDQAEQLTHQRPGNTGQIIARNDAQLPDFALAAMQATMPKLGMQGLALLEILLTLVRNAVDDTNGGIVTINLDALARRLHGRSRGPVEAAGRRAALWDQVRFIASLRVEGPGPRLKIRDRGKMVEMAWFHPLITIEGVLADATGRLTLDGLHPAPVIIKVRASDRFATLARLGNRALPVLGELGRVMTIAAGKPGGSWARAITHALVFEARKQCNRIVHVTRKYLLTHYPGHPHPLDLLGNPKSSHRAVEYWAGALEVIRRDLPGLIEHIEDPEKPTGRGWAGTWLEQRVLIRLSLDAPEMAGLRDLISGRDTHALEASHRQDRDTIRADLIRKRRQKASP